MQNWQTIIKDQLQPGTQPVIVIVGATASGKTNFSITMAKWLKGQNILAEVINADSRQLYQYLDVGTAKISKAQMQGIPHHLLSIVNPKEVITAAWYQAQAQTIIQQLHQAKKVPIIVGGSMLYLSSIIDGLTFTQASNATIRQELEAQMAKLGAEEMYKKLVQLDPLTASKFSANNQQYVLRALEIYATTQQQPSQIKNKHAPTYNVIMFGMDVPRATLYQRIEKRTMYMLTSGWIEEVSDLRERGFTKNDPGLQSHGYGELVDALEQAKRQQVDINLEELCEVISRKSKQYAKRQLTWWRGDERIHWLNADEANIG